MRSAVITIAHGRHEPLLGQQRALRRSDVRPDLRIVVAIDDPVLAALLTDDPDTMVVRHGGTTTGLPLAAARNAGARHALTLGAELLIFLDVDCLPGAAMVGEYVNAAVGADLLCGPVAYLPPPPPGGYQLDELSRYPFHPARPVPAPGSVMPGGDHRLFWSLSFAVRAEQWRQIGGFNERYVGYGGEDTDFAMLARAAGIGVSWVGGAAAYHQWHPVDAPPIGHLADILRNGAVFAQRWGWWPMEGWLRQFADLGLVDQTPDGRWTAIPSATAPAIPSAIPWEVPR